MAETKKLDTGKLKDFENAAAGHQGVLSDESGELIIKPCTQAEIDFYQESLAHHPKFYELMPTFMGTLSLGAPTQVADPTTATALDPAEPAGSAPHGSRLSTETAIVLENLEHGFTRANVLDLKLGAKLYDAASTRADKAARLDDVAAATTSGTLHFRIAGMKVWNGRGFDMYDKLYGRKFSAHNVRDGFAAFFSGLEAAAVAAAAATTTSGPADASTGRRRAEAAQQLLETLLADVTKARHSLERSESRMFSASLLLVYEGDADALAALLAAAADPGAAKAPRADELAPTRSEIRQSLAAQEAEEGDDDDDDDDDEDGESDGDAAGPPLTHQVKLIDFAHAAWTPGQGPDTNVIVGLKNIEEQLDLLIARFEGAG